jgi:hypothetical protein
MGVGLAFGHGQHPFPAILPRADHAAADADGQDGPDRGHHGDQDRLRHLGGDPDLVQRRDDAERDASMDIGPAAARYSGVRARARWRH